MNIYVISVKKTEGKYGMSSAFRHDEHKSRDIKKLYNSLALRLVFIIDVVAMLLPFLFIVRFYYEDRINYKLDLRLKKLKNKLDYLSSVNLYDN